jgi:hypothetical protein
MYGHSTSRIAALNGQYTEDDELPRAKAVSPRKKHLHLPLTTSVDLFGTERIIQVMRCRVPSCRNFRVPTRTQHAKPAPLGGPGPIVQALRHHQGCGTPIRCMACNK